MAKTALIYVRRSFIRKGEEAISPKKQQTNCQRICDEAGWIAEIYRDAEEGKHYTATSEEGRPAWLQLKRQLGRPDVVAVVVDSLDRAYRSLRDFLNFLALIDKYDVRFISRRESIDTESAMGQALLKMMMIFFELEAEMASQRVSEIIEHRKGKGVHWGSNPFGLDRDENGILIANEDLSTAILLLRLYATGRGGYSSVATELNTRGRRFRDRYGKMKPFTRYSVRSVVNNVLIYLGYVPQGRGKDQRHILLDPKHDLVDQLIKQTEAVRGQHEQFIDRDLANQVLAAKRSKIKPRRPSRVYLLSGILHCAHCGVRLRGQTARWDEGARYRHHGKACRARLVALDANILEMQVIDLLQALELPPQLQEAIRARAREQGALLPGDDEAQQAITRLHGKLDRLKEMRLEGEYSKEEYGIKKAQLVKELQEWERRAGRPGYNIEYALLNLDNVAEVIRQGPPAAQKRAIQALFERIEINRAGEITRAVPREWCRPLFATLQLVICDIKCPQGNSNPCRSLERAVS